jgi:hypothetical protein
MENIKTEIHGEMDSTKVSTNTMARATGWVNVGQRIRHRSSRIATIIRAQTSKNAKASRYHRPIDLSPTFRLTRNV